MKKEEAVTAILRKRLRRRASQGKSFHFDIQPQEQTNWCWAAVGASVALYFDKKSDWTQCDIATEALGIDACGNDASSVQINKPWLLDEALSIVACLSRMTNKPEEFPVVKTEIEQRLPVCIRVQWRGGGGHFLAIRGWFLGEDGEVVYIVEDPKKRGGGTKKIRADKLRATFQGIGRWSHTYFVTQPGLGGTGEASSGHDPDAIGG